MFHIEPNSPQHLKIGKLGEDIACKYLKNKGYKIIERNFRKKWGEIDIICLKRVSNSSMWNTLKDELLNVLRETSLTRKKEYLYVPQGTNQYKLVFVEVKTLNNEHEMDPEENITKSKMEKLIRTCNLYVSGHKKYEEIEWQIDAVLIKMDNKNNKAKIRHIESAIY